MNTQPIAGLPSLPQPEQPKGSTPELIEANSAGLEAARQSLLELEASWKAEARAGRDCTALEAQIDQTKRKVRWHEERGEALAEQLADEKAAAHAAQLQADHAEMTETLAKLTKERGKLAQAADALAEQAAAHGAAIGALNERLRAHGLAGGQTLEADAVAALVALPLDDGAVAARLRDCKGFAKGLERVQFDVAYAARQGRVA